MWFNLIVDLIDLIKSNLINCYLKNINIYLSSIVIFSKWFYTLWTTVIYSAAVALYILGEKTTFFWGLY